MNRTSSLILLTLAVWTGASMPALADSEDFSMLINDAFVITGRGTVMTGHVTSGSLETGDTVCVPLDSGKVLSRKTEGIERFRKVLERAEAGQMVGIQVSGVDSKKIKKGAELTTKCDPATDEPGAD